MDVRGSLRSDGVAVVRERRARIKGWIALAASVALVAIAPPLALLSLYGVIGAAMYLAVRYAGAEDAPKRSASAPATISIEGDDLVIASARSPSRVPRRDLMEGWLDSFGGEHRVVIRAGNHDMIWIRVRDLAEGVGFLRALGFAADQRVFTARLVSVMAEKLTRGARVALFLPALMAFYALTVMAPVLAMGRGFTSFVTMLGLLSALLAYPVLRLFTSRRAIVGTDGVAIRGFFHRRFVPYADIAGVDADERGVWLRRHAGGATLLATMERMGFRPSDIGRPVHLGASTEVLLARVREAMASGGGDAAAARLTVLDRGERSLEDWRRDLAALVKAGAKIAGYRRIPIERDDLVRVLEDGAAPAERRIAAAIALSEVGEPEMRSRVRVVADACADEALRVAIEKAAEGELEDEDVARAARAR